MRGVVTKAFMGVRDGTIIPRAFAVGDEVEGDLAEVAIRDKLAKRAPEPRAAAAKQAEEASAVQPDSEAGANR